MNFKDLLTKLQTIEEGQLPIAPTKDDEPGAGAGDESAEEGMIPMPISIGSMSPEKEQDHVTMNVSINGSGAGGVRDLMDILRHIEHGNDAHVDHEPVQHHAPHQHSDDVLFGDSYENSVHGDVGPATYGVDSVTSKGNDMNANGGDHRMRQTGLPIASPVQENLVNRLQSLYVKIKEAEDKPKTMSRAAKGVMKYGKDGMKALAKAGKEGKDLDKVRDKYNKYD